MANPAEKVEAKGRPPTIVERTPEAWVISPEVAVVNFSKFTLIIPENPRYETATEQNPRIIIRIFMTFLMAYPTRKPPTAPTLIW